jgi:hypothetical protein
MKDAHRIIILIIVSPAIGYALLVWGIIFPIGMAVVLLVCIIREQIE